MQDDTKKYQLGNQNMGFMGQIGPNMAQNIGFMGFMGFMDFMDWVDILHGDLIKFWEIVNINIKKLTQNISD